jgi:hypothetical protein
LVLFGGLEATAFFDQFPKRSVASERWPLSVPEREHFFYDLSDILPISLGRRTQEGCRSAAPGNQNGLAFGNVVEQFGKTSSSFIKSDDRHIAPI